MIFYHYVINKDVFIFSCFLNILLADM